MDALVGARFVRAAAEQGFTCFDPRDDGSALHPTRACGAWVPIPVDLSEDDEDGGAVVCPACGLEHTPLRDRRSLHEAVTVAVDDHGVIAWMEAAVRRLDPDARRSRRGVGWDLVLDDADAEVVWLDRSLDSPLATRAYAAARPVVYVVTSTRTWAARFRDDPWLQPVGLAEWFVRGDAALRSALARRQGPPLASEPTMRPWSPNRALEDHAVTVPLGARVLVVDADRATLDGHEVVAREGVAVLAILRVLAERWHEDFVDGKPADAFCTWTPEDLRDALKDAASGEPDTPTLRRQLHRLRAGIRDRYQQATGVRLDDDAVIESVHGQGYRVHPTRVLARLV